MDLNFGEKIEDYVCPVQCRYLHHLIMYRFHMCVTYYCLLFLLLCFSFNLQSCSFVFFALLALLFFLSQ